MIAICIAIIAVMLLSFAAIAKRTAKYIGSKECLVCHADSHPAQVAAYAKTAHRMAMTDVAVKPAAIVAKFDDDSPIAKADIKYVLGVGKVYQNYLDKSLNVLPATWIVKEQKWVKAEAVDGATQCAGCHVTNFDPETKKWTELGVSCESCHGPGAKHAESMEAKDIKGLKTMDGKTQDMVCGQCHGQGTDTTGKYAFSTTYVPGDDLTKSYKLNPPKAGAANSQYNHFITSKHYAGGMKCTTCHDTHGDKAKAGHQLRMPINDQCLGCHKLKLGVTLAIESLKAHAPTAADDATCASCHMEGGVHTFAKAAKAAQ